MNAVPKELLSFRFSRSGGPGGQNVNKVATKVEMRADLSFMDDETRERLIALFPKRVRDGVFVVTAQSHRSQAQNRKACMDKLLVALLAAAMRPKERVPTAPTVASKAKRREAKDRRQRAKAERRRQFCD